jgi:hypothetical protein
MNRLKEKKILNMPLFGAATSMILIVFVVVISLILVKSGLNNLLSISSVLIFSLIFFVFAGFYYLGKLYNQTRFIRIVIGGFILFILIIIILSSFSEYYSMGLRDINVSLTTRQVNLNEMIQQNVSEEILVSFEKETYDYILINSIKFLLPLFIIYFISAIYISLFSVELMKLKELRNVKTIGILNIIYSWAGLTILGFLFLIPLAIISYFLTIRMFLEESKKAKE